MENALSWIRTIALVVVAVAAIPLTSNQCTEQAARKHNKAEAMRLAALGRAAREAKDPQLAVEAFSQASSADPLNNAYRVATLEATVEMVIADGGVINAGNALRLQARLAGVLTRGEGNEARTLLAFGRVLQYRGQSAEATERFKEAVKKAPKLGEAHLLLGDALLKAGSLDAAGASLSEALTHQESPLAHFALGQVRIQQERWDDAVPHLEKASKALTYSDGKLYTRVSDALETALALDSNQAKAHHMLGDAWAQQKRPLLAMGAYRLAFERSRDLEAYKKLGRAQGQLQLWQRALETWGELRALLPTDPEPHCHIGAAAENLGDVVTAKGAYKKCITIAGPKKEHATMVQQADLRVKAIDEMVAKAKKAQKKKKR